LPSARFSITRTPSGPDGWRLLACPFSLCHFILPASFLIFPSLLFKFSTSTSSSFARREPMTKKFVSIFLRRSSSSGKHYFSLYFFSFSFSFSSFFFLPCGAPAAAMARHARLRCRPGARKRREHAAAAAATGRPLQPGRGRCLPGGLRLGKRKRGGGKDKDNDEKDKQMTKKTR
jgi:hypothetical protein